LLNFKIDIAAPFFEVLRENQPWGVVDQGNLVIIEGSMEIINHSYISLKGILRD